MEHENQYNQPSRSNYNCLLFDLDDTLYPFSSGLSTQCTKNIEEYMVQKLGIEESKVHDLCVLLYKDYGTTMAGLRAMGYDFDYDDFHSFVHGRLPYEMLKPDPVLRHLLLSLPIRRVIFSNANKAHIARVVKRLGLEDCFEAVICFETLNPFNKSKVSSEEDTNGIFNTDHDTQSNGCSLPPKTPVTCKPLQSAFEQAFKIANINPQKTLFFDDSFRNLQTAKSMGLHTVLVGSSHRPSGVDYALESLHNVKEALPELWDGEEKPENITYCGKLAKETSVRA